MKPNSLTGRVRRWVMGLTLAGFFCGAACGWAAPSFVRAMTHQDDDPYASMLAGFGERYGVSKQQKRDIRLVMAQRDRDILRAYADHRESLPRLLRERVEALRRQADQRIELGVLDSEQRARYRKDRLPDSGAETPERGTASKPTAPSKSDR